MHLRGRRLEVDNWEALIFVILPFVFLNMIVVKKVMKKERRKRKKKKERKKERKKESKQASTSRKEGKKQRNKERKKERSPWLGLVALIVLGHFVHTVQLGCCWGQRVKWKGNVFKPYLYSLPSLPLTTPLLFHYHIVHFQH